MEDRHPIVDILQQTPAIPENCQWAMFLRNHDELTLEMVTDDERDYMYRTYAPDTRMRINLGIRRRLAPLLENNRAQDRIDERAPVVDCPARRSCITATKSAWATISIWATATACARRCNGAPTATPASRAPNPQSLYLPPIMDAVYGFQSVNVEAQSRSPSSPLQWMRRLIAVRSAHPAFGRGSLRFLHPGNRKILAYVREYQDEIILCVANLARSSQPVELDLRAYKGRIPVEMLGRTPFPADRRSHLPTDVAGVGILLVRARARRQGARVARRASGASRAAGAGDPRGSARTVRVAAAPE